MERGKGKDRRKGKERETGKVGIQGWERKQGKEGRNEGGVKMKGKKEGKELREGIYTYYKAHPPI